MNTREMRVTPELATELLKKNLNNRPVSQKIVDLYADHMANGKWIEGSHQGIAISENGELIDGQHRLLAVVQSNVPIRFMVVEGVKPEAFMVMDQNYQRTIGNSLSIRGIRNASTHTAAYSLYRTLQRGYYSRTDKHTSKITSEEVINFYDKNGETCETYLNLARYFNKKLSIISVAKLYGIMLYLNIDKGYEKTEIDKFFSSIHGLSPVRVNVCSLLMNRLSNDKMSKLKMQYSEYLSLIIKAFNFYITGVEVDSLSMKKNEEFPAFYSKLEAETIKIEIAKKTPPNYS